MVRWLPAILWMVLIFYLSSQTGEDLESIFPFFQSFDWGHFIAYFVLALTFLYALWNHRKRLPVHWLVIILCILYGITDEFHQYFVPTRTPDIKDLMTDTLGALVAVVLFHLLRHVFHNKS